MWFTAKRRRGLDIYGFLGSSTLRPHRPFSEVRPLAWVASDHRGGAVTSGKPFDYWLTDMDGVLVHEEVPIKGAQEFIDALKG